MKARVYKSTGSWYFIKTETGTRMQARLKGIFKIDGITSTNPIAVGDEVEVEIEEGMDSQKAVITEIYERKNYIARATPQQHRERHIVASNIDQLLLFATLKNPRTSQGFIDRFLVAAEAFHIMPVIVFNKADIYRDKELKLYEKLSEIYSSIGYEVMLLSISGRLGLEELADKLKGKTTLIAGHSGVGKSTFINYILPDLSLKTGDVSGWSGKGMHTTTFAEMFDLPSGGSIIDTPGIREFGITDIPKPELSHYFVEMRDRLHNCQFNNCLHVNEPGCAIKEAVEKHEIFMERYISYYNILHSVKEKNY